MGQNAPDTEPIGVLAMSFTRYGSAAKSGEASAASKNAEVHSARRTVIRST